MINIIEDVRKYSQKVLLNNRILSINLGGIRNLIEELKLIESRGGNEPFPQNDIDTAEKLGLNLFFNVVNFCFMDPNTKKEYIYRSKNGNEIMRSTGLFQAMKGSGVNWKGFASVAKLSRTEWLALSQVGRENPLYLGVQRYSRIIKFANYLIDNGYKNPMHLLEKQHLDVGNLLRVLVDSKLFEDKFLKRAQITVRGIEGALSENNICLKGMRELTCMADYRIPQVFYNLNVVNLSPRVINSLSKLENIKPDSEIEISLRASVVVIGKTLSDLLNMPEYKVDVLLWKLSQKLFKQGRLKIPHMIVATDKY